MMREVGRKRFRLDRVTAEISVTPADKEDSCEKAAADHNIRKRRGPLKCTLTRLLGLHQGKMTPFSFEVLQNTKLSIQSGEARTHRGTGFSDGDQRSTELKCWQKAQVMN